VITAGEISSSVIVGMTYLLLILEGNSVFLLNKNGRSEYGLFLANIGVLLMQW